MQRREGHDASVQPGIADIFDARELSSALLALDLDGIDPGTMRRVALELFPARDCAFLQFLFAADDLEGSTLRTIEDWQREAPVALLGDHPIVHVAQPVQFAIQAERWYPGDLLHDFHDLVAQLIHRDE